MSMETKTIEYTHLPLGEEIRALAGYYCPGKENILKYKDREVLYVTGNAALESSCCGSGCWCYANVPGYVLRWQYRTNERGLPVTEIEPVRDKADQDSIKKLIRETDPQAQGVCEIYFW